jgi:hypothetical protein
MNNLEPIKKAIMDGYKRGICDKNGDSILKDGILVQKPRIIGVSKTYVVRNGKCVEK